MRFVTYNIAFGFNARSLIKSALGHFCIHLLLSPRLVKRQSQFLNQALDLALSVSPDILCLNETLPYFHANQIRAKLSQAGFSLINDQRENFNNHPLQKDTILAIKQKTEKLDFNLPYAPSGRNSAAYIPKLNLAIVAVHLNVFSKARKTQIKAMQKFLDQQVKHNKKNNHLGRFQLYFTRT